MKNLTGIITAVLIILFFGFLVMQNCDCCKSTCSKEKTACSKEKAETETAQTIDAADSTDAVDSTEEAVTCADDCQKACCLGCKATEGDVVCLADHSCCADHDADAGETDNAEKDDDSGNVSE